MKLISPQFARLRISKPFYATPLIVAALSLTSLSASADVMLGAYLPNDGFSRQAITGFNDVVPKKLAYVNVFSHTIGIIFTGNHLTSLQKMPFP